jgi:NAD+ dependent glucose-6-phosphate dehydrogenase
MKVLVTGAYGNIGSAVCCRLAKKPDTFDVYTTDRRAAPREHLLPEWTLQIEPEKFSRGDLADLSFAQQTVKGMDCVVHMAANASPRSAWINILNSNLVATYNVFEACRLENIPRIVYASSIMAIAGYATREPYKSIEEARLGDVPSEIAKITHEDPVWPLQPYGASKVWGEALARAYSTNHGISILCLRIGCVPPHNRPVGEYRQLWCSLDDITQIIERCITAPQKVRFDTFFGISNNKYCWVDIAHAREVIGYVPKRSVQEFD